MNRRLGFLLSCLCLFIWSNVTACDQEPGQNLSQPELEVVESVDKEAPLGRDAEGRPFDYVYDPDSPYLMAAGKALREVLKG